MDLSLLILSLTNREQITTVPEVDLPQMLHQVGQMEEALALATAPQAATTTKEVMKEMEAGVVATEVAMAE